MNILYPKFPLKLLPHMTLLSVLGALIAGFYGIIHDQITYSISEEYFTKLKFNQFRHFDLGLNERVFVAQIGFMATWWVGFISAWLIARLVFPTWSLKVAYRKSFKGFGIIFGCAILAGIIGYILGITHSQDYSYWDSTVKYLKVTDKTNFVSVALIHNSSYLGGLIGLVACLIIIVIEKRNA